MDGKQQEDCFEELLNRHQLMVRKACFGVLGVWEDAEEACQEAFARAFAALAKFEGRSMFRTWLYRIALNVSISRKRKLSRRAEHEVAEPDVFLELARSYGPTRETFFQMEELQQAFACLENDKRQIITQKYVEGRSLREIARFHSIGLSAAKMRLYRAVEELQKHLIGLGVAVRGKAALMEPCA